MSKKQISTKNDSYFKIIPLAVILFLIPIIVRFKEIILSGAGLKFGPSNGSYADFFNYYKSVWLIALTILALLVCLWYFHSKKLQLPKLTLFLPLGIYYIFVLLSTLLSEYKDQAIWGYQDRREGFWVITCYFIICILAAHFITTEFDIKLLFGALIISASILSILGVTQFWGVDILQTEFGKHLMLSSSAFEKYGSTLDFKFPNHYIYSTLYNPNYVGSYFSMLFPISLILFLFSDKLNYRIISGIFSCLAFINLVGCLSTTGYIGSAVSVLLLVILLHRRFIKSLKPMSLLFACLIGLLFLMNVTTDGTIFPEFYKQSVSKQSTESPASIKPDNSLANVILKGNKASLILANNSFNLEFDRADSQCRFTDSDNKDLGINVEGTDQSTITFTDPAYEGVKILITGSVINITATNTMINIAVEKETGNFKFIDHQGNLVDIANPERIGFEGRETFGSSRGYIWSRTLPLLKDTVILGHGPDTYTFYFPQYDFMGKLKAFNSPYIIVDKPHNMYMQIGINTGILSLLAFIVFILWYIISSLRLYIRRVVENTYLISGVSCLVAVVGFLVSGLANDSVVSVSPVFWILAGIGIASNRMYAALNKS